MLLRSFRRLSIGLVCLVANLLLMGPLVCDRDAARWFLGDIDHQRALADSVAALVREQDTPTYYATGIVRFDGQSAVAIDQMAILGLGQLVLAQPEPLRSELRARYLPAMRAAADRLADPRQLKIAAQKYGQNGVVRMDAGEGHAYLGYVALGLGMLRRLDPDSPHNALHDRLVHQLSARLYASETGLIETYPGETWPPDVAAVAGAIGLHARSTGAERPSALDAWERRFVRCSRDEATGWLRQRVHRCGQGAPRGSGTALASYFLSFSHPELARELHRSLVEGQRALFGFGAQREYPASVRGAGDIDSGPVIFGVSVGATGFGLASARISGDRETFTRLYRTTRLFGAPMSAGGGMRSFAVGGALGNALLLAMLTAERPQ